MLKAVISHIALLLHALWSEDVFLSKANRIGGGSLENLRLESLPPAHHHGSLGSLGLVKLVLLQEELLAPIDIFEDLVANRSPDKLSVDIVALSQALVSDFFPLISALSTPGLVRPAVNVRHIRLIVAKGFHLKGVADFLALGIVVQVINAVVVPFSPLLVARIIDILVQEADLIRSGRLRIGPLQGHRHNTIGSCQGA